MTEKKIRALIIFEILGRPADFLIQSLNEFIDSLSNEKGITIASKKIHDAKRMEKEQTELYSSYAEVELILDNLNLLFYVVTSRLPSHVEIIEPEELTLKNCDISSACTELAVKLHKYDEVAKVLSLENQQLKNRVALMQQQIKPKIEEIITSKKEKKSKKKN